MYSDQVFFTFKCRGGFAEMAAVCWVWERKMKQAEQRERAAEQRRKARCHDDYCAQEAARLYREKRRM
mgnify:CR=1 FL=1